MLKYCYGFGLLTVTYLTVIKPQMQGSEPNCLTHVIVWLRRDVSEELERYDWLRSLTIGQHLDPLLLVVVLCWGCLVSRELGPICAGCALACGVQVLNEQNQENKMRLRVQPCSPPGCCGCGSDLRFYCRRCSAWGLYSLAQAARGSPRYVWRSLVSVQSKALSPCQLQRF